MSADDLIAADHHASIQHDYHAAQHDYHASIQHDYHTAQEELAHEQHVTQAYGQEYGHAYSHPGHQHLMWAAVAPDQAPCVVATAGTLPLSLSLMLIR